MFTAIGFVLIALYSLNVGKYGLFLLVVIMFWLRMNLCIIIAGMITPPL